MSADLTPQQIISLVEDARRYCGGNMHTDRSLYRSGVGEMAAYMDRQMAAITVALDAYKRLHMRLWLEERGVYVARASTGWYVAWGEPAGITVSLDDYAALEAIETANPYCWSTADGAYGAAAEALGYPGIGEEMSE